MLVRRLLYPLVMSMSVPYLQSPDAKIRLSVLCVVDAICAGCEESMKLDLESLMTVILPSLGVSTPSYSSHYLLEPHTH